MRRAALVVLVALTGLLAWQLRDAPRETQRRAPSPVAAPARVGAADAPTDPPRETAPPSAAEAPIITTHAPAAPPAGDAAAPPSTRPMIVAATHTARPAAIPEPARLDPGQLDPAKLPKNYTLMAEANPVEAAAPESAAPAMVDADSGEDTISGINTIEPPPEDVTFDGVRPEDEDITFDGVRDVTYPGVRVEVTPPPVMVLGPPAAGQAWDGRGLSPTEADTYEPPDYTNSAAANPPPPPPGLDEETLSEPPPPAWEGEGTIVTGQE